MVSRNSTELENSFFDESLLATESWLRPRDSVRMTPFESDDADATVAPTAGTGAEGNGDGVGLIGVVGCGAGGVGCDGDLSRRCFFFGEPRSILFSNWRVEGCCFVSLEVDIICSLRRCRSLSVFSKWSIVDSGRKLTSERVLTIWGSPFMPWYAAPLYACCVLPKMSNGYPITVLQLQVVVQFEVP